MYICPVCGYEKLTDPPKNFNICSCCGTEFGFDDFETPYSVLRSRWITSGYRWFSRVERPSQPWNPVVQLGNLLFAQDPEATAVGKETASTPEHFAEHFAYSAAV